MTKPVKSRKGASAPSPVAEKAPPPVTESSAMVEARVERSLLNAIDHHVARGTEYDNERAAGLIAALASLRASRAH